MTKLVRYEAARKALAEAVAFDEVMNIMNIAEQAALYAKQANDNDLIEKATEIRVRAQRKAGEMLVQAREQGQRAASGGTLRKESSAATLSQIGITKDQSSRYQQLAAMPAEHFETAVATAKATAGEVTTAFMLREAKKSKPIGKPMRGKKADALRAELKQAQDKGVSMLCTYARLTLQAIRAKEEFTEQERELLAELEGAIHSIRSVSA
jgi:hypothetical protein